MVNTEPKKIPHKFLIPRFDISNYKVYSLNELDSILTKIKKLYNRLHNNRGLINQIETILGKKINYEHREDRDGDIKHSLADISKAREKIKYIPKFNVKDGLKETVKWFQQIMWKMK